MAHASTMKIPVIDISGYLDGDSEAKANAAAEMRKACEEQGFLQIIGHNVSPEVVQNFTDTCARFFALPLEEKEKVSQAHSPCFRGYERIGGQKLDELDEDASPDQKEGFSVRRPKPLGGFLQGPNQWPESMPDFKKAYMKYFDAVHALSKAVFRLMALSLGLEEEYFDAFAADPDGLCLCRAHHYPPSPPDAAGTTRGVGAHTDFGALTLLLQDDVGGLEVLHKATNTWHHVPPVKGAFVCNIGDLMQRWTNDRYKSTMHRVISPLSGKDRYSCAFFNDGGLDMTVECLPTCIAPGAKAHYGPIQVKEHLVNRYKQSYGAAGTVVQEAVA